ncbi:MAG: PorT family protein [Muribaculaceae bacterium]|nr:PorT family protein [Muribaculaceae bacterium]
MKKILLSLLLLFSITLFQVSAKTFSLGLKGGVTLSSLSFKGDFSDNFSSENRAGFFIGPMANVNLPLGFNVDAALMYSYDLVDYNNQKGGVTEKRHILEIPVNLKWRVSLAKVIGIYFTAGPDFAFNLNRGGAIEDFIKQSLEEDGVDSRLLKNETKSLSMGVGLGAGIELFSHLNIGFNYIIPVDYTYKYILGDTGLEFSSKVKRWQISAAYIF